jgi:hypothetical protein
MKSLIAVVAVGMIAGTAFGQKPVPKPEKPAPALPSVQPAQPEASRGAARIRTLQKELRDVLTKLADEMEKLNRPADTASPIVAEIIKARHRAIQADLDLCVTDSDRVAVLEKGATAFKKFEKAVSQAQKDGAGSPFAVLTVRAARIEAEISLERARPLPEPDRVGQIRIESGGTNLRDGRILKPLDLYPGKVLTFPQKEEAEKRLKQAFPKFDVAVDIEDNPLDGFKDITVRIRKREK